MGISSAGYFFIAIVALILGLSTLLFYRVFTKEKEFEGKQEKLFKDYSHILKQARMRAKEILSRATDESIKVYKDAHITNEHIIEELDKILQESLAHHIGKFNGVSDQFVAAYTHSLTKLQETIAQHTQQKIAEMQQKSDETFSHVTSSLEKEIHDVPKTIEKKVQETLASVDAQAETYKQEKLKKIDALMQGIVLGTYQEILGKSITISVHQQLLIDALEKAKKEGVFAPWQIQA